MGYTTVCAVPKGRVFSRFGHKKGIDFGHFGALKIGYGFSTLVLNWVCGFLEEALVSSLSIAPSTKAHRNLRLGQMCQQLSRSCHKWGVEF